MEKKYKIEYKGKSINTKNWLPVTEEELKQYREEYYKKPSLDMVINQMGKINNGGVMIDKITRYYFRPLMAQTLVDKAKWTVDDIFNNTDLCGIFKSKVVNSPQVFNPKEKMSYNIERAISLGGKGYARIPTQFPFKAADYILKNYNLNNNYYDFSCGWGVRLLAALKYNINYYGTDPNDKLCTQLNQMVTDYKSVYKKNNIIKIYTQGSEIFIPELENKIGLCFSSPPYFSLEDYRYGNQSYKPNMSYQEWLKNYLYPTLDNSYKYLISNGILAINIKNTDYSIATDANNYLATKMTFVESIPLKNIKRLKSNGGLTNSTDEEIYIYKKQLDK